MKRKGQLEFVAIAGLILVVLVAIVFVVSQFVTDEPPSTGIEQEAKTIKDSVNNLIKAGLTEVMVKVYNQGGYMSLSGVETVKYDTVTVPVWQACEKLSIPDIEKEIALGVSRYISKNLDEEEFFFGKRTAFDFGKIQSEVKILRDRILVELYLPTTVEGYDMPMPYTAEIGSNLREIMDFSEDFVNDARESRFFEMITLTSLFFSNPYSPGYAPLIGTEVGCYKNTIIRRDQIVPSVESILNYNAGHFLFNVKPLKSASNPFYTIQTVGGKTYDLQMRVDYPEDDWNLDSNLFFSPDPVKIQPKPISVDLGAISIPIPMVCIDVYGVTYSFRYPLVAAVRDEVLGQWFKFALMVEIDENRPGDCEGMLEGGKISELCANAGCMINITVIDEDGEGVPEASVVFHECDLGTTDYRGNLMTLVPCGVSEISVSKEGFRGFGNFTSYHDLINRTIRIRRTGNMTIHFYGIPLRASIYDHNDPGRFAGYWYDSSVGIKPIDEFGETRVHLTFRPAERDIFSREYVNMLVTNVVNFTSGEIARNVTTMGLSHGTFEVNGIARNMTSAGEFEVGYIDVPGLNTGDHEEMFVYVPLVISYNYEGKDPLGDPVFDSTPFGINLYEDLAGRSAEISLDPGETEKLMDKLGKCGLEAISFSEQAAAGGGECTVWTDYSSW